MNDANDTPPPLTNEQFAAMVREKVNANQRCIITSELSKERTVANRLEEMALVPELKCSEITTTPSGKYHQYYFHA